MRIWLLSLLLMAFLGSGNGATGAPLEAYARLPSIENVAVSPAGRTIALIATNGLQRTIIVRDLESGQTTLRGAVGEHKIRDLKWAGEQHLIVVASIAKDDLALVNGYREWFFGSLIDLNTKKIKPLMAKSTADSGAILGPPEVRINDGQQAVFVPGLVLSGGKGLNSLFRVDLRNGTNRIVEKGAPDSVSWVIDSRGQPVAQEVIRGREWSVIARSESGWRTLLSLAWDIDRPYLVGLGRDDASLIYGVPDGKGQPPSSLLALVRRGPSLAPGMGDWSVIASWWAMTTATATSTRRTRALGIRFRPLSRGIASTSSQALQTGGKP
jgi:hypothetical protein